MSEAVRIFPGKKQKFILVRLVQSDGDIVTLWSNPDVEWHKDILTEITAAGHIISENLGGGWLLFRPEDRALYIWGKSDRFGSAPRSLISGLVEEALPDIDLYLDQEPA